MKMKMKTALMAGALALSMVGQANAAITNGNTLANNMVLSVWDTVNLTSYTANLGSTMSSFLTGITFGGTSAAPSITGSSTAGNFTFTNAGLSSYLSTANTAALQWSVTGVATGQLGYGTSGILTTTNASAATVATTTAGNLTTANGYNPNYIATVNSLMGAGTSVSTTSAAGGLAYVGAAGNGMGNNFGGSVPFSTMAGLGQSQNFFFITPTTNARGQFAGSANYQFANAGVASTWTLGTNGLTYTATSVAPVPEAGEWALMLSGFGLIGFIATRRKQASSITFA